MEVSYKREMNHNYLIIEPEDQNECGYESKMLVSNCIEGLLKFRIRQADGSQLFYYEITSQQPLSRLLENRYIKSDEIRQILIQTALTLNRVEEYLLKEEQIVLKPEYIYIEPETFTPSLCMVPGYISSFPDEFTKLLQFFLEKVDHKDQESVVLAYSLYHESLKENYGMKDLLAFLSKKKWSALDHRQGPVKMEKERQEEVNPGVKEPEQKEITSTVMHRRTASLDREKENKGQDKKDIFLGVACQLGIMVAAPILLWCIKGKSGLERYGLYLAAGEAVYLFVAIIFQVLSLRAADKDKGGHDPSPETRWMVTPEYKDEKVLFSESRKEAQEEGNRLRDNIPDGGEEETQMKTALLADFSENGQEKEGHAVLISLDESWENIKIPYTPFLIGKSEELADYQLNKNTVSRLHLRIDKSEDIYTITDLNSTNGTNIRGRQLETNETVKTEDGDIIYIADLGFQFAKK